MIINSRQRQQLTFVSTLTLLQISLSFADIAPPPPPPTMSPESTQANKSKTAKKAIRIETPAVNQDKPTEQQEQFPVPELVIRYKDGAKIEEYRVNGQLRYAKITPTSGPSYYLIDSTGDGSFDQRSDQLANPPIQQWLLYTW